MRVNRNRERRIAAVAAATGLPVEAVAQIVEAFEDRHGAERQERRARRRARPASGAVEEN
jgi:hypothetical protein